MFGNKSPSRSPNPWLAVGLVIALGGCARPHYVSPKIETTQSSSLEVKFSKLGLLAEFDWVVAPTTSTNGAFQLSFRNLLEPLAADQLKVYLWMPSMGHGSVPVIIRSLSPETFLIERVFFIMRGDWSIRLQILDSQKAILDEAEVNLVF